ncbi:MAG: beta-ketoacyl-[acyl-carrier-protein] synthase family protein [Myxococcota bacterium]
MPSDCRLSALGLVNALGDDAETVWKRLLEGQVTDALTQRDDFVVDRTLWVGAVTTPLPKIPASLAAYDCRNNAMALAALSQVEDAVRDAVQQFGAERVGVVMGTSTSGVSDAEIAIRRQLAGDGLDPSFDYAQLEFGGLASFVAEILGTRGPAYAMSTACSSGARALASARSLLRLGVCDAVVAGAADTLCGLTTNGFSALQALSPEPTNPCSVNRRGITLGEGAAVFLVTRDGPGPALLGVGESSEAHHMSAPEPTGAGAEASMRGALADAGLPSEAIGYLNLHGTGTPLNDRMECLAVDRVFGGALPVSSTKPLVGHTLGAAGAMEAAFCWLAVHQSRDAAAALPPHLWDGAADPELPTLHFVAPGESRDGASPLVAMTNSFGFGGNNCSLVLGTAE